MEYPLTVNEIKVEGEDSAPLRLKSWSGECGDIVAVRPCADEFENKTFLGVYIGDIALSLTASFNREDGLLSIERTMYNPAIFIPDRNTVVYGAGSWWGKIKGESELREITDATIENTWYVKALKQLSSKSEA